MVIKSLRPSPVVLLFVLAVAAASCGDGSPTSPSGDAPDTQNPGGNATVNVAINPNPVPFSGQPVTDSPGCATLPNTWFYNHVFTETGGNAVTFNSRIDYFDGFAVNTIDGINIGIPARGTATIAARWCSGNPSGHTAQTTFSGVDSRGTAVTLTTPVIRLMGK